MADDDDNERDEDRRSAIIYAYIKRHAPGLLRPGVTLSPEQVAHIRELQQQAESAESEAE